MYPHTRDVAVPRGIVNRIFAWVERLTESDSFIVKLALVATFVSLLWFLTHVSLGSRTEVPVEGGVFREGIVGTPRFVNPILAVTRADKDLSELMFDGLVALGKDGVVTPNVAESITVSEDGLTYNVVIRKDVTFHDGTPLSARDVVFTVGRITEPMIASPLRPNFDGVTVEQVGEYELNFVLEEAYAPFIENLSFGILPEHIWENVTNEEFPFAERNSDPIGAGPYKVAEIRRSAGGIPETYILTAHDRYHRGIPKIERIVLTFFPSEDRLIAAFKNGALDALSGIDPSRLFELGVNTETHSVLHMPLPRTFAIFFNQNKSAVLRDTGARQALSVAIDRNMLVDTVLGGYGIPLAGPLPKGFGVDAGNYVDIGDASETARDILRDSGWKLNEETGVWEKEIDDVVTPLELSIATVNNPLFEATAESIRAAWEKIGVRVTVKQFEQSDLTQGIIRPRDYEALLFGTQVGRALDYYSFWHSSQRNDPGLNVALYANITTDALLTEARTTTDITKRNEALTGFKDEILKETPALFLYQPEFIYVFPHAVTGASFVGVGEPHERFASVHDWYVDTDSLWSFLAPSQE
jgi:peptide/nickel transport system substrate-binding protein